MAKRSPILGFNHNFRHRGLVFHVQTEDSGVNNPHIFTHLFNGGVILSSRKLTYDSGAADEVVKALMQAQHKAMLKDLKRGEFDDKIDQYFGGHEELVPRQTLEDVEATDPSVDAPVPEAVPEPLPDMATTPEVIPEALLAAEPETIPEIVPELVPEVESVDELELDLDDLELVASGADTHTDMPASTSAAAAALADLEVDLIASPTDTLRSAAPPAPMGETPSGAVLIHATAPDSAPEPPGAVPKSPGSYAQHTGKIKRKDLLGGGASPSGTNPSATDPAAQAPTLPPLMEPESHRNLNQPIAAPVPRPPRVSDREVRGKGRDEAPKLPRTGTQPLQSEPSEVPRRRGASGPIATHSSVIVGAPPQIVGGSKPSGKKPRRAREGSSSLFGKDLISEKSLDEVILAYLSEDGKDRE